jgi:hypothetical protein
VKIKKIIVSTRAIIESDALPPFLDIKNNNNIAIVKNPKILFSIVMRLNFHLNYNLKR